MLSLCVAPAALLCGLIDAWKVTSQGEQSSREVLADRGGGPGLILDDDSGAIREARADVVVAKRARHYQTHYQTPSGQGASLIHPDACTESGHGSEPELQNRRSAVHPGRLSPDLPLLDRPEPP